MPCDLETVLESACASGIGKLTERVPLLQVIAQLGCQTSPPVASFIERAGITDPTQIAAVEALYASAVFHGWWDKCDIIYPFVGGTALAHSQNLKSASFTVTWFGTVTQDANGITGNGTTGYGATGYLPGTSGMSVNSCAFTTYLRTHPAPATVKNAHGSRSLAGATQAISLSFASTGWLMRVHGQINVAGDTTTVRLVGACRYSATNVRRLVNGVVTDSALAVTGLSNCELLILAQNNCALGTQDGLSDVNLAGITFGSALDAADLLVMSSDWQTFQTALGRAV